MIREAKPSKEDLEVVLDEIAASIRMKQTILSFIATFVRQKKNITKRKPLLFLLWFDDNVREKFQKEFQRLSKKERKVAIRCLLRLNNGVANNKFAFVFTT